MAAMFDSSMAVRLRLCSNLENSDCRLTGRVLDKFGSADSGALACCSKINRSLATQVIVSHRSCEVRTPPATSLLEHNASIGSAKE